MLKKWQDKFLNLFIVFCAVSWTWTSTGKVWSQSGRLLEVKFVPTERAQLAVWVERVLLSEDVDLEDNTCAEQLTVELAAEQIVGREFIETLALTEAVALRGIGNRPGALQMNSGFKWPYGRREGTLPIWAHRRVTPPEAETFPRIIFQARKEGYASRMTADSTRDDYFCLSFENNVTTREEALDAVTCPSVFRSDKGRYLTQQDVNDGYAEPFELPDGELQMRSLPIDSLYPPRRDVERCSTEGCLDHEDVALFAEDARSVMPNIDSVTMATPRGDEPKTILFSIPNEWEEGHYEVWLEVNTEGDYNEVYNDETYPRPTNQSEWDSWALRSGYAYRGQPSVVFHAPFYLADDCSDQAIVIDPQHYGSLHGEDGNLRPIDETISNDPQGAPGSGADRLKRFSSEQVENENTRMQVRTYTCEDRGEAPGAIEALTLQKHPERRDSHQWGVLEFVAPERSVELIEYEIFFSTTPLEDEDSLAQARRAQGATLLTEAPQVDVDTPAGQTVRVEVGGLVPETAYFFAVRAKDACNQVGGFTSGTLTTDSVFYSTVEPCFVATAAYGTPSDHSVEILRAFRDNSLKANALGRLLTDAYYVVGPLMADGIRGSEWMRSHARFWINPVVMWAYFWESE